MDLFVVVPGDLGGRGPPLPSKEGNLGPSPSSKERLKLIYKINIDLMK